MNMKPYVKMSEIMGTNPDKSRGIRLLSEANGCTNGCCSGISVYDSEEFNPYPGSHSDQEGFYVLEGKGSVRLDELEFAIEPGDSFVAGPGVKHTIRTDSKDLPVKVFYFHSAK